MNISKRIAAAALVGLAVFASPLMANRAEAHTHFTVGFGFGVPAYAPAPVYVAPAPVYAAPPAYTYVPAPVVVQPAPAYYAPYPRYYYAPRPVYRTRVYW